jgi:hypothetical protein
MPHAKRGLSSYHAPQGQWAAPAVLFYVDQPAAR